MDDLISRKAAIDVIVNSVSEIGLHDNSEVARYGATFRQHEIIDIIEKLPAAQPTTDEWCTDCKEYDSEKHCCPRWNRVIRQTAEDMKAAQPHWIPVTERLPEEDGTYIVCLTDGSVFEYDYLARWAEKWTYVGKEVTAWMPLPEPYREGEQDE